MGEESWKDIFAKLETQIKERRRIDTVSDELISIAARLKTEEIILDRAIDRIHMKTLPSNGISVRKEPTGKETFVITFHDKEA